MFSGIVQAVGRIVASEPTGAGRRLLIDSADWTHRPEPGESICVSGCCLTLAAAVGPREPFAFDAVPETLAKTTFGRLAPGDRVNLERSVTPSTLMDGHVVQGHVEAVGEVAQIVSEGEWRVRVTAPADLMPCIVPKGSITVDGVSLTVAAVDPGQEWFEVVLIPTTLERTTLADLKPGTGVNLETDVFARTVVHVMRHYRHLTGETAGSRAETPDA